MLPAGGDSVPLAVFLAVGAGAVLLPALVVGIPATRTALPRTLRRIMLGITMALQLSVFSLFVSAILAQGAPAGGAPPERFSSFVFLMGSGLSAAMGVVLGMTFKPDEQWTRQDDAALEAMLEGEADPSAAADRLLFFVHPRSSVVTMILLFGILPGGLLTLVSPWLWLAMIVLASLVCASLCASVHVNRAELRVKLAGILPVIVIPVSHVDAAVSLQVTARDYGGWGLRKHSGEQTFLAGSGAAVVLRMDDGGRAVIGTPNLDVADEVAALLNRRAGKSL